MPAVFQSLLSSDGFLPGGESFLWHPGIMGLNVASDVLIGLAWLSIAGSLGYLTYKGRRDIGFRNAFLIVGLFLLGSAAIHFFQVWTLWEPSYWASGGVKIVTALASVATAIALPPLIPSVLVRLREAKQSQERAAELETALGEVGRVCTELERSQVELERVRGELEHAHGELRRERQLADAQQVARLGSWEWELGSNRLHWSDELYRIYGLQPGSVEITYQGFLERVHPRDRARVASIVRGATARRESFEFEHDIVRPDGTVRTLHARGDVIVDDKGKPIRMVATGQDVTERRAEEERARQLVGERAARAEAEQSAERMEFLANASTLLASSLEYERTLEKITQLMVPVLGDYCVVDVLEEGEPRMFRRVAAAHADRKKQGLLEETQPFLPAGVDESHPIVRAVRTGEAELVILHGQALRAMMTQAKQAAGIRDLGAAYCIVVPFEASGRVVGAITIVTSDTTRWYHANDLILAREVARRAGQALDNARLYRDAQEANRTKSNFLAVMSHELRTPLNAIVGYADLMEVGIGGALQPGQTRHVDRIKASAWHLLRLIEEILTYARIEAGREKPRFEQVDVREIAVEALALVEPAAAEKKLPVRLWLRGEAPTLQSDPVKLRQILTNLLSNAVKFTNEGGVDLAIADREGWVILAVRDTGIGIAPEHLHTIFEPFRQIEDDRTRRVGGTGLGLAVCQRLAHLLGGEIEVESTPGAGSEFRVLLPMTPLPDRG